MGILRQRAAAAAGAGGGGAQARAQMRARSVGSKGAGAAASSWVGWLGAQEGHPKHVGWLHPVVTCSLVTTSTIAIVVRLADALQPPTQAPHQEQLYAAVGLAVYTAFLLGVRVVTTGSYALYEFLWACNLAMLLAALGLATARPLLVAAGAVAVSIDQGLWYVDVLGFLLTLGRKFPVGVAKYLTWPQTSWARRVTSTHHLWFMPYCLVFGQEPWPLLGFPLSVAFVAVLDILCRWVTPFRLPLSQAFSPSPTGAGSVAVAPTTTGGRRRSLRLQQLHQQQQQQQQEEEGDGGARYLNVNLVYELWKDIDVAFLKVSHPHPAIHLTRLVVLWSLLNVPFALVLFPMSRLKGGV